MSFPRFSEKWPYTSSAMVAAIGSLIPPFVIVGPIAVVAVAVGFEQSGHSCEVAYRSAALLFGAVAATLTISYYVLRLQWRRVQGQVWFFGLCASAAVLLSGSTMVHLLGPKLACHGDGQSVLVVIYSAPLVAVTVMLFGLLNDLVRYGRKCLK